MALLPNMASAQCPDGNHPHMIDLGLPSGTKWACCNVGATTPEGYGNYYAWGETQPKDEYSYAMYPYSSWDDVVNGSDIAGTSFDAATVNWGTLWRMPSKEQIRELLYNCSDVWMTQNGVNGRKLTGSNGGTLFLPAAGFCSDSGLYSAGSVGSYWSSSYDGSQWCNAFVFGVESEYTTWGTSYRWYGRSVRPVAASAAAEPEPYAVLSSDGQTVTFYYDDQKATRGGIDIKNSHTAGNLGSPYGTATIAVFDASFANYRPVSTAYWFQWCSSLTTINGIENLKTDNVTDMSAMFDYCSGLTSLDVSGFNTSKVTNMDDMFSNCRALTSLDVSGFDTSKVTNMGYMFYWCSSLTSLDVSGFNTSNVAYMYNMFTNCSSLTSLDLIGFNTSYVTDMREMFQGCSGLTSIDVSGFNTSNVKYILSMFNGCSSLTTIYADEAKWSTASVTVGYDYDMFKNCTSLVGGNGTVYNANHINAEYARIDKPGQPGYFTQKEPELEPIDNADFSSDIDEETDLDGNVVGDIYYNISSGEGSYDPSEGCIVVTTPTDDSVIDGQDIFGEDFQSGFTGIVFMVPEGKGTVKVEAETTGTMMLKVKIGNNDPIEMELEGRLKVSFPYNVTEPTYVYIYGGTASAAPDMAGSAAATGELRLYGVEVVKGETGIRSLTPTLSQGEGAWYSLDGRKLQGKPTQKGVYIMNGKKVVIK